MRLIVLFKEFDFDIVRSNQKLFQPGRMISSINKIHDEETHVSDDIVEIPSEMKTAVSTTEILNKETIQPKRIEQQYFKTFKLFAFLGFFLVQWNGEKYKIHKNWFCFYYIIWFLVPLAGLVIALLGWYHFGLGNNNDVVDDIVQTSLFVLGFAVVPSIQTYCLKLLQQFLPRLLKGFITIEVRIDEVMQSFKPEESVSEDGVSFQNEDKENDQDQTESQKAVDDIDKDRESSPFYYWMPLLSIIISLGAFISILVIGLVRVTEWYIVKKEWPFLVMLFTFMILPTLTTLYTNIFIIWFQLKFKQIGSMAMAENNPNNIKKISGTVYIIRNVFKKMNKGFLKYILFINFLVEITVAIFCLIKLLDGFQQVFYLVQLCLTTAVMWVPCHSASQLLDEHNDVIDLLTAEIRKLHGKVGRQGYMRRQLGSLRDVLQEETPIVQTYGDYKVNMGLLLSLAGFIITYSLISKEIITNTFKQK